MVLVSGADNYTWYPICLVSCVKLFIIIYCEPDTQMVLVSGGDNHTWSQYVWYQVLIFLLLFQVKPDTQIVLVSGADNHTWYPIFFVSGLNFFINIYCETWHPNDFGIRWRYSHQIPNIFGIRCETFYYYLLWNLTPKRF